MRTGPIILLSSGDMSQATLTSIPLDVRWMVLGSIQAVISGSPTGTLKLQMSILSPAMNGHPATVGQTWTDVASSSISVSGAGSDAWNITDIGYPWLQVVYTMASGTGSLNLYAWVKGPA